MTDTQQAAPPRPETYNGDFEELPPALNHLRDENVWVLWRWEWNGKKWTKEPYRTNAPRYHASTSDPDTWGSYTQARAQVHSGNADGIGFALRGRGIGTIDLDHCRDPATDKIEPWALDIVDQFPDAYVEVTVSGTGLRIIGTSEIENWAPKHHSRGVEFFSGSTHYNTLSCCARRSPAKLPPIGDKMKLLEQRVRDGKAGRGPGGGPNFPVLVVHRVVPAKLATGKSDSFVLSGKRSHGLAARAHDAPCSRH